LAQYAGLVLAIGLFAWRYAHYWQHLERRALLQVEAFRRFLQVNWDIFVRTLCLTFAFGFFYSRSSLLGATVLASNTILQQFLNWMSYGIDGFAYASESLVGKYKGAGQEQKLRQSILYSFAWGMLLAVLFSVLFIAFGPSLLWVFTNEEALVEASMPFLIWVILFPVLSTPCYLWDGIFIGLTASKAMRNSMIWSLLLFLLSYYCLVPIYGNHALWAALLILMIARGATQGWMFWRDGIQLK
ncbi:MAG: MATE family efflux transporter, partial [Bacteroidota bacterium]